LTRNFLRGQDKIFRFLFSIFSKETPPLCSSSNFLKIDKTFVLFGFFAIYSRFTGNENKIYRFSAKIF